MRKTKVTEIVYKPFAEKLVNIMKLQLEKPKSQQRWDRVFRGKGAPINAQTKNVYRGINYMMAQYDTYYNEYKHCIYATEKQWKILNCEVVKGSPSLPVVFYKTFFEDSKIVKGKKVVSGSILLYSKVYNVKFIDGDYKPAEFKSGKQYSISEIDNFVTATKVKIDNTDGKGCFYNRTRDFINMELKSNFKDTKESDATVHYYSTLFHELTHSTGHESRTNRIEINLNKLGSHKKEYAFEELVAEIGSIMLSQRFNIEKTIPDNHAKYLNSWIKSLQDDYTLIAQASAQAQKAVDFFIPIK